MPISDEQIIELTAQGRPCSEIAKLAGVSRQRIHQRVQRLARRGLVTPLPSGGKPGAPSKIVLSNGFAEVELTQGCVALVDVQDVDLVAPHKWYTSVCARGHRYAATFINGVQVRMHRHLARPGPGLVVDHIDGDGLNNRRSNLRSCTQAENLRNQRPRRPGRKGVRFDSRTGRWGAGIVLNGKRHWLGHFATEAEAAAAYNAAAKRLHGEFARLNEAA